MITPENTVFVILSFEGPDEYSQAGGLGVRVSELSRSLAEEGFTTHLFFIGDSEKDGEEQLVNGRLIYHRWCQWISRYHPYGVYDGEEGKKNDFDRSVPSYLMEKVVMPAIGEGKVVVVMSEEWHTAQTVINLQELRLARGIADKMFILWNANNMFGFHRIDWGRLSRSAVITTISKYMKHYMWGLGVNPLVIPNGIPRRWMKKVDEGKSRYFRQSIDASLLLTKVGRFDPNKRWIMAIETVDLLKQMGLSPKLLMRGGIEAHGDEVRSRALSLGLKIGELNLRKGASVEDIISGMKQYPDADIIDFKFFIPEETLRLIYRASDAVLANSGREPFGLVGLEVMACGGIAVTGATGEDYAHSFHNCIVVDSEDPRELATYLLYLFSSQDIAEKIRKEARKSARNYSWEEIIEKLKRKIMYIGLDYFSTIHQREE